MTGYDIYNKVCNLLGYFENGENRCPISGDAFADMLNQIACDLKIEEITSVSDKLNCTPPQKEALTYGCAWILSVALRDTSCGELYARLYNLKRTACLNTVDTRTDILPKPLGGG